MHKQQNENVYDTNYFADNFVRVKFMQIIMTQSKYKQNGFVKTYTLLSEYKKIYFKLKTSFRNELNSKFLFTYNSKPF